MLFRSLLIYRNESLILLFEYIQAETVENQNYLPWLNKTSLVDASHTVRELVPLQNYISDNQEFLEGYINEAKPYHANIQDYINGYTAADTASASVVDFDVPYPGLTANTPISAISPTDITLETAYNTTYTAWFNNYQSQKIGRAHV